MLLNITIFLWYGAVAPWPSFGQNDVIPVYRLIFLAILVFLGTPYMIWNFGLCEAPHDDALDMSSDKISDEEWDQTISQMQGHQPSTHQVQRVKTKKTWFTVARSF